MSLSATQKGRNAKTKKKEGGVSGQAKESKKPRKSAKDGNLPPGKKLKVTKMKKEPENTKPDTPTSDIKNINNDDLCLELPAPDKEFMQSIIDYSFTQLVARKELDPNNPKYGKYFTENKRTE